MTENDGHGVERLTAVPSFDNLLNSADLACLKPNFYSVRMLGRIGQYIFHNATRTFSRPLVLLLDDVNFDSRFYVFSVLSVHNG
jgi:hypothetical protein